MEMKENNVRGFKVLEFKDWYDRSCSIQNSSSAEKECIWLGISQANPKIMTSTGWVDYPIHDDVFIPTRMHLTREQVKDLIPILQKFVDEGEI